MLDKRLPFSSCYLLSRFGNTFAEVIIWFTFQRNNKEPSLIPFLESHGHGAIKVTHYQRIPCFAQIININGHLSWEFKEPLSVGEPGLLLAE